MSYSASWLVTIKPNLVAIDIVTGKIMFLVVEGQDSTCPRLNYDAAKYDGHRRYGSGNDVFSS